jgi:hypothetical protein
MQRRDVESSGLPTAEEYCDLIDGPYAGLLKAEMRLICKRAHFTERQTAVWEWVMVCGMDVCQAAQVMECDESTARQHLVAALSRARRVKHAGLLTVLVETFGWQTVQRTR